MMYNYKVYAVIQDYFNVIFNVISLGVTVFLGKMRDGQLRVKIFFQDFLLKLGKCGHIGWKIFFKKIRHIIYKYFPPFMIENNFRNWKP